MQRSLSRRRRLRAPAAVGALAVAFGAAFAFGHADGEPKVEPVRAAALTVAADLPPIPALAASAGPPALAKPAARRRRPKRHGDASPAPDRVTAEPDPGSPAATSPSAPRPAPGPAPSGGGRRPSGGGRSTGGGGESTGHPAAPPVVTPAPVQPVAPAPIEPEPEEGEEPEEEAAPEEEAG